MQEEILSLKLRMSEQEEVLKGTIQRLRSTSRTKESMEHFIVNQCKCFCVLESKRPNKVKEVSDSQQTTLHVSCWKCGEIPGLVLDRNNKWGDLSSTHLYL